MAHKTTDRVWLGALIVAGTATITVAQTLATGNVRGTVTDQLGAVVPNAQVEIACAGGVRSVVTTSASGEFGQEGLPSGRCLVTASSDAFEPETIETGTGGRAVKLVLRIRPYAQEVVVTPNRGASERAATVPEPVSVTSRRDIDSRPHQLLPQVLQEEPGVLVQQTTSGQTSPIIRGFTGQSNVYLLDGVRLNVSTWRPGPSQYTAWVNGGPVEAIEVVRGGGSVQYGSDALGGTVQFLSGTSIAGPRAAAPVAGTVSLSAASANEAVIGRADLGLHAGRVAIRVGGSRTDVGDLRAGGAIDSHAAVTRFLGLPSSVVGDELWSTGYTQGGGYLVAAGNPGRNATVRGIYMHESQTGVSRYDRILGGEGLYRSGFDPQTLDFGVLRYEAPNVAGLDGISAAFSINRQADGRFEQARPGARLDRQSSATTALGYQGQAHKSFGSKHQLLAGAEFYDEKVTAERQLVDPTVTSAARPDIPNDTTYSSFGAFAQHSADVLPNRLTLRGGVRAGAFRFATAPDPLLGVVEEHVSTNAVTFQGAAVIRVIDSVNVTANVSRAFRAPNAGDLGNIGLTGGGGFEITPSRAAELDAVVGSTGAADARSTGEALESLRPEVVYQYEVGVKGQFGKVSAAVNTFDMELFDFIQRRALVFGSGIVGTTLSGFQVVRQDAAGLAYIAQDVRPIASRVNVDRGRISGFDAVGDVRFNRSWSASGFFSLANGKVLSTGAFIRRMPPAMGHAKVRWQNERLWAEGVMNLALEQTRLDSGDLGDARIGALRTRASIGTFFNGTATDLGLVRNGILVETGENLTAVQNRVLGTAASAPLYTSHPGYAVFSLRGGISLGGGVDLSVIGENLGDKNYRLYGSGLDAPGRSVHARVSYRF